MASESEFLACVRRNAANIRDTWEQAECSRRGLALLLKDTGDGIIQITAMPPDSVIQIAREMEIPEPTIEALRSDPGGNSPVLLLVAQKPGGPRGEGGFMLGRIAVPPPAELN